MDSSERNEHRQRVLTVPRFPVEYSLGLKRTRLREKRPVRKSAMTINFPKVLYSAALLLCVAGCATSSVIQSWANPQTQKPKSVLIFGVTKQEALRRNYEDTLARLLTAEGLEARASYNLLQTEGEVHTEKVLDAVRKVGVDSVFITRLVRLTKEVDVVQEPTPAWQLGYAPWGAYYNPYWPTYYADSYRLIERELAYIESNLYQAQTSALIMSVLTRTEDPNYGIGQVDELAHLIVEEFRQNGFLRGLKRP